MVIVNVDHAELDVRIELPHTLHGAKARRSFADVGPTVADGRLEIRFAPHDVAMYEFSTDADFYIASDGNDDGPGNRSQPFRTLERARDAVRVLKAQSPDKPIVVLIRGGPYRLDQSVVFSSRDSGSARAPITYKAYPGETPIFSGGRLVTGWKPYRDKILAAQLPQIENQYDRFREVFFIIPGLAWNDHLIPIRDNDPQTGEITVARRMTQVWDRLMQGNRFYVENLLEELDQPGEWCFDARTLTLYFWPPQGTLDGTEVTIPVIDRLIELRATTHGPVRHLHVTWGINFDNSPRKAQVYGNLCIDNTWGGVFIGGGYAEPQDCIVENNVFVNSSVYQFDAAIGQHASGNRFRRNIIAYAKPDAALMSAGQARKDETASYKGWQDFDFNLYFQSPGVPLRIADLPGESLRRTRPCRELNAYSGATLISGDNTATCATHSTHENVPLPISCPPFLARFVDGVVGSRGRGTGAGRLSFRLAGTSRGAGKQ